LGPYAASSSCGSNPPSGHRRKHARIVSLAKAPPDSMTPTTKLGPPVPLPRGKGGERRVSTSFSNFVVAIPSDSDRSPMRARPPDPWVKFLLLLLLLVVLLLMVLALVAFALAQVTPTP
jgi:hypothetical protein